jgi:hypothetical protein
VDANDKLVLGDNNSGEHYISNLGYQAMLLVGYFEDIQLYKNLLKIKEPKKKIFLFCLVLRGVY